MKPLPLLKTILRLLTFRSTAEELDGLDLRFLGVGLLGTWLVGIGRYWDSPTASAAQKTGLGSVVYVFVLSAILWIVALPLRPHEWRYPRLLTFITLTSFPAALYALPVERWVGVSAAIVANIWFLSLVAIYRVALYLFFMARGAQLGAFTALVAVMLPVTLIIATIVLSGYSGIVMDIMGGFREREPNAQDGVNDILGAVTMFGCLGLPFWAIVYGGLIAHRGRTASNRFFRERAPHGTVAHAAKALFLSPYRWASIVSAMLKEFEGKIVLITFPSLRLRTYGGQPKWPKNGKNTHFSAESR